MIRTPTAGQDDYDAICAAVMESARVRRFLEEYARRNRNTDTNRLLAAIERNESRLPNASRMWPRPCASVVSTPSPA
jgi:hypothetical protein